jgi:hypothetical protein
MISETVRLAGDTGTTQRDGDDWLAIEARDLELKPKGPASTDLDY